MIPHSTKGKTIIDFESLSANQDHGDGGGRRMISSDNWVWPPPQRVKNPLEWSCSCASKIQEQQRHLNANSSMTTPGQYVDHTTGNNLKALRFLFSKELTYSDIKKKYKILLHKRDVEKHLPRLESTQGIQLCMEDKDTHETWNFKFRFRITNNSKVHSLEGTRRFVEVHNLKAGDSIFIYNDDTRRKFVIAGVSKGAREASNAEPSVTIDNTLVPNKDINTSPSSYIYCNQLSDFPIIDEMEEAAIPHSTYSYVYDDTWTTPSQLERLAPLDTVKFSDTSIDDIFWM